MRAPSPGEGQSHDNRQTNVATVNKAIETVNLRQFTVLSEVRRPEFQRHDLRPFHAGGTSVALTVC